MVRVSRICALVFSFFCLDVYGLSIAGKPSLIKPYKRELLQDLVTWDEHSLFVRGERIMFYSGEFHPWRIPVPGLWVDVFQKIKALGYNGVSFYVDWALLEGDPGHFTAEGIFSFDPFFDAAAEAGIYLLARPGPYINAEVSGGGFPGWIQRNPAILRTNMTAYIEATQNYVSHIGAIIAKAQITNGGPVVLFQPENEYTFGASWVTFPDTLYFGEVEQQYRDAGIVLPYINNDAWYGEGRFAPGTPSAVDIYGVDSYPAGFVCAEPSNWTAATLATDYYTYHEELSPSTPFSIVEFQGGAVDLLGGPGYDACAALTGPEFMRVFDKNDFASTVTIFNTYMTYGGTNWGNLGEPGAYTSYDYGAVIKEDRSLIREKYSEAKLEANFLAVSPAYLVATPGNLTNTTYTTSTDITVTPLWTNKTNFYVVRHSDFTSYASTPYKLTVSTSIGEVSVPRLGGSLTLNGRDSKIHVTDYDLGGIDLIYSSAEIMTWKKSGSKTVLLLYGGADETHEFAVPSSLGGVTVEGSGVKHSSTNGTTTVNWQVSPTRRVVSFGQKLEVYLLWRNDAYNYFVLELPAAEPIGNYSSSTKSAVVAKGGYLLRTASVTGNTISLTGDINATTDLEIISGQPQGSSNVYYNGKRLTNIRSANGRLSATIPFTAPAINVPSLPTLEWKYLDSLPEIQSNYSDALWTAADHTTTPNTLRPLTTPTSLYAGDYGYHTGSLLYRGHFTATGNESTLMVGTQAGAGYGHSIFIGSTFVGSWPGNNAVSAYNQTVTLPSLVRGKKYVITVVIDHMGTETNWTPGYDQAKTPRGILYYTLGSNSTNTTVSWKLTGNLGGEQYRDKTRGPLNEGGMYAERQGYHQPDPPSSSWPTKTPYQGISSAGIGFYSTSFDLNIPLGYDIPMSFVFTNATSSAGLNGTTTDFRVQLYVNGYQFGKYFNNIGPQTTFPVPEGVLNYNGKNWVALTLWALDAGGAKLNGFELMTDVVVESSYSKPAAVAQPKWAPREGAY